MQAPSDVSSGTRSCEPVRKTLAFPRAFKDVGHALLVLDFVGAGPSSLQDNSINVSMSLGTKPNMLQLCDNHLVRHRRRYWLSCVLDLRYAVRLSYRLSRTFRTTWLGRCTDIVNLQPSGH